MKTPTTLIEAVRFFSDIDRCNEYMVHIKWPDGNIECPHCHARGDRIGKIATRKMLRCKDCRRQFSYKVNTIFEDSPLGLDKWFVAVWVLTSCKNGISSYELAKDLGITQKSAWFMLHRIRLALQEGSFQLKGTIEADETFVGGIAKNMHKDVKARKITGRGAVGKEVVQGIMERGGKVIAQVVKNQKRKTLQPNIREVVEPGSTVYSDALPSYEGLEDAYAHEMIDHAKEYVRGDCHTNSMENFWALLKRCINGTYIAVMPWHLFRYVDEQVYRFNEREKNDGDRFDDAMSRVAGKRITYAQLIQQG